MGGKQSTYEEYLEYVKRDNDIDTLFRVPFHYRDFEMCLEAVNRNGRALRHAPKNIRRDKEFCLIAIKQDGRALQFVSPNLRTEKMCIEAVKQCNTAIKFVPGNLKDRITFLMKNNWKEPQSKVVSPINPNYTDEETKDEKLACCVCMSNRKCVLFETCNHLSVCFSCSKKLNGKCPLCRLENQKTRIIFH